MKEIIDLEYRRLKLYKDLKSKEWTNSNCSNELEYVRHLNLEMNNRYQSYYKKALLSFMNDYVLLSKRHENTSYFDTPFMDEEELVSYGMYQRMKTCIENENSVSQKELSNIYINYINNLKNSIMHDDWLKIKYSLMYLDTNIEEEYVQGGHQFHQTIRSNNLIFIEYEKIKKELKETTSFNKKRFCLKAILALTDQLTDNYAKKLIMEEISILEQENQKKKVIQRTTK